MAVAKDVGPAVAAGPPGAVKVFVDPHSLPIIHGTQIDYVEGLESSGFVFDNPNVASVCSCSKSFNAAWSGDAE